MDNVLDYVKRALKEKFVLTKFLDSTEVSILKNNKNYDFSTYYYGGYEEAERLRAILLYKDFEEPNSLEFNIACLKIEGNNISTINHRHVLGTVLSLGIKREMIGDIVFDESSIYLFTVREMVNFIKSNLIKINNVYVSVNEINVDLVKFNDKEELKMINVASLRLDGVIAHTLNISRTKACEAISKGLVQVNHLEILNISYNLKNDDLISVRHFGRIRIVEIEGVTKKNRLRVKISVKH